LRLQRSDSKPLTSLLGLPLIERTIRTARDGGATSFVVVTGYRSEQVGAFVSDLGKRLGTDITLVHNPDWETKENGASLLAAREHLDGPFLLTMADH
ncbi:NTP transferase domain-containing protein, partial [Priestia megaterium]|uniref:NTP transferase domain-containing protein n=1 Tax=Priestia megaterium TaxID=1404 RepID=UPI0035B65EB1